LGAVGTHCLVGHGVKGKYLSSVAGVALTATLGVGAQAQTPAWSWNGSYFGAYAGWAWGTSHATTNVDCGNTYFYMCDSTMPNNGLAVDASGTGDMHGNGFLAGLQGGYNWQFGNYVYGIESDFGAFHLNGSRQVTAPYVLTYGVIYAPAPPATGDHYTIGNGFNTDWLYTLRGRFGWTIENFLHRQDQLWLYATGGLALTDLRVNFNFSDTIGVTGGASHTGVIPGWVLGAGFEYMLNSRYSIKAEYLHLDFGKVCASGVPFLSSPPNFYYSQGISTCADLTADLARIGINYRL
jgi:outer membrane immunogenic protein